MGKRQIRQPGGYFTVEAALLLPFVIGTIVYIIYFQFFWYNRCLMDQETAMLGVRAVQDTYSDGEKIKQNLIRWREGFLTDRYINWEADEPTLICGRGRLSVRQKGSLEAWNSVWNAETAYENKKIQTSVFLRICRKIGLRMEEKK